MPTEPVTITTTHNLPLFDPEDHRKQAAAELGLEPTDIHCVGTGPDGAVETKPNVFSEDGTVLQHREVEYTRKTTWEPRPRLPANAQIAQGKLVGEPEPISQNAPKLSRGARWHGTMKGVEANYISDGKTLVLLDSPEGQAVIAAIKSEEVAHQKATAGARVG